MSGKQPSSPTRLPLRPQTLNTAPKMGRNRRLSLDEESMVETHMFSLLTTDVRQERNLCRSCGRRLTAFRRFLPGEVGNHFLLPFIMHWYSGMFSYKCFNIHSATEIKKKEILEWNENLFLVFLNQRNYLAFVKNFK